jgi:hypothetical protein
LFVTDGSSCLEYALTRGGLAIVAMRQFAQDFFVLRMRSFFDFKNSWHFKDIFREIEAFVKISILFEGIFREIERSESFEDEVIEENPSLVPQMQKSIASVA